MSKFTVGLIHPSVPEGQGCLPVAKRFSYNLESSALEKVK